MQTMAQHNPIAHTISTDRDGSSRTVWAGRGLSGIAVLFLIFDGIGKLLEVQPVVDGTLQLGYPREIVFTLGVLLLGCVAVYLIPGTSMIGAVLLTGYLGGAVATHMRVGSPLFTHTLFPTYVATIVWFGLVLRDARLRAFLRGAFATTGPVPRGGSYE